MSAMEGIGGGGGAGGLSSLLQNKLFLQYLAGAGADLSAYGANTDKGFQPTNINAITQQNIQSQNFMKLIKQLLGPDGSKGTLSSAGLTLNAPPDSALYSSFLGGEGTFKTEPSLAPTSAPTPIQGSRSNVANPFAISQPELNVNPADLAGLTTQDLVSLMGMKSEQDKLRGQSYRDLVESFYKGSAETRAREAAEVELPYKRQLTKESEARTIAETPSVTVEGVPFKMTQKDFLAYQKLNKDDKTAAVKNYEFAQGQGFKGTFTEFQDMAKTTHKKDYDEAVKDGYKGSFNTWMTEMAKAGAINLGERLEEKKAFNAVETQNYFSSGKFNTDITKRADEYHKDVEFRYGTDLGKVSTEMTKFKAKAVVDSIIARNGEIQSAEWDKDGKTMVWKVIWPNGESQMIKYPLK